MIHKTLPTYRRDYTEDFESPFRPLPEVVAFDTCLHQPQHRRDPYWEEHLYDKDKLEYKDTHNKPNDQTESNDMIADAHVSDALQYGRTCLWTVNPHLQNTSPLPNLQPRPHKQQRQSTVIEDQNFTQLQVTPDEFTRFLPLSTNSPLKIKRKLL